MKNAYSEQTSLEVDQQLTPTSNLAIAYQHLRGLDILIDVNLNTPTCTSAQSTPSTSAVQSPPTPITSSTTPARTPTTTPSPSPMCSAPSASAASRISYTWSKAIDDVSEFFFSSPVNNYNIGEDRSLSDDDQRHRVVFDATVHTSFEPAKTLAAKITHGFQLSGILTYYSPFPFNITSGASANTTANIQGTTLRPCLPGQLAGCALALPGTMIGRNAGVGFATFNMNARLSRTFALGERFQLQGIAEAFNALNHRNDLFPTGTYGTSCFYPASLGATGSAACVVPSTFGKATAAADPRNIELALKLSF